MMAVIGVILGILCFGVFMFIINKSQKDGCDIFVTSGSLYFTGFIFSITSAFLNKSVLTVPLTIVYLAVPAGIASISGFLFEMVSLKAGGRLSVINIIGNLSALIPIAYSVAFFHERFGITKCIGILLFIVFIFLLNDPENSRDEKHQSSSEN